MINQVLNEPLDTTVIDVLRALSNINDETCKGFPSYGSQHTTDMETEKKTRIRMKMSTIIVGIKQINKRKKLDKRNFDKSLCW